MTDDVLAAMPSRVDQEASGPRCQEFARTDRGWERCHRNEHAPDGRHHVRDRSWTTDGSTPQLRLGQSCTEACTWPDLVLKYRGRLGRPG